MSNASIRIQVDPTNPGQFFACCGLLELADRACGEATGAFGETDGARTFEIETSQQCDTSDLIRRLGDCSIISTLSPAELSRLKVLLNRSKDSLTADEKAEKASLAVKWNAERILFGPPFNVWIDWWNDEFTGGSRLKTWAGKQLAWEILDALQRSIRTKQWDAKNSAACLFEGFNDGNLPLYFDADIGGHSSSIDVGFSLDALSMRSSVRAVIELAAFVGLQRFRPRYSDGVVKYSVWKTALSPLLASVASAEIFTEQPRETCEFGILFRSKYLKSFLPSHRTTEHP